MRNRFTYFKEVQKCLKKDFEAFIINTEFPLSTRWQMFLDAPKELSNHNDYIYRGFDKILDSKDSNINWVDETDWRERHGKVDVVEAVDELFSKPNEYDLDYPGINEVGFLTKIKEQVLKDNIKSFIYDW